MMIYRLLQPLDLSTLLLSLPLGDALSPFSRSALHPAAMPLDQPPQPPTLRPKSPAQNPHIQPPTPIALKLPLPIPTNDGIVHLIKLPPQLARRRAGGAVIARLAEGVEEEVGGGPEEAFAWWEGREGEQTTPEGDEVLRGLQDGETL